MMKQDSDMGEGWHEDKKRRAKAGPEGTYNLIFNIFHCALGIGFLLAFKGQRATTTS